jgi:maltoporin
MSISSIASSPAASQAAAQQPQPAKVAHHGHHRKGEAPTATASKQSTPAPTTSGVNKVA